MLQAKRDDGKSKGWAICVYASADDAQQAIETLNDADLDGAFTATCHHTRVARGHASLATASVRIRVSSGYGGCFMTVA